MNKGPQEYLTFDDILDMFPDAPEVQRTWDVAPKEDDFVEVEVTPPPAEEQV